MPSKASQHQRPERFCGQRNTQASARDFAIRSRLPEMHDMRLRVSSLLPSEVLSRMVPGVPCSEHLMFLKLRL